MQYIRWRGFIMNMHSHWRRASQEFCLIYLYTILYKYIRFYADSLSAMKVNYIPPWTYMSIASIYRQNSSTYLSYMLYVLLSEVTEEVQISLLWCIWQNYAVFAWTIIQCNVSFGIIYSWVPQATSDITSFVSTIGTINEMFGHFLYRCAFGIVSSSYSIVLML